MFGIGGFELFIILLFGFLIFGPDKLPEMAKTLGAALRKFNQAREEMESVIKGEVLDVANDKGKPAAGAKTKAAPTVTQESFAERKARYDKERTERKRQEEIEANRRAMKEDAARKAAEDASDQAEDTSAQAKPALTPEELFGTKPVGAKPAPKSAAAQSTAASSATAVSDPASDASKVAATAAAVPASAAADVVTPAPAAADASKVAATASSSQGGE